MEQLFPSPRSSAKFHTTLQKRLFSVTFFEKIGPELYGVGRLDDKQVLLEASAVTHSDSL